MYVAAEDVEVTPTVARGLLYNSEATDRAQERASVAIRYILWHCPTVAVIYWEWANKARTEVRMKLDWETEILVRAWLCRGGKARLEITPIC